MAANDAIPATNAKGATDQNTVCFTFQGSPYLTSLDSSSPWALAATGL